jgi:hypothetical protein
MRLKLAVLVLALGACNGEREPQGEAASSTPAPAPAPAPVAATAPAAQSSALLDIPDDAAALKRLTAMGYTVHEEQGHLHAPGVNGCPAMAGGPVM